MTIWTPKLLFSPFRYAGVLSARVAPENLGSNLNPQETCSFDPLHVLTSLIPEARYMQQIGKLSLP